MNRRFTNNPMNPEHHQRHPREQRDEVDELSQGQGTGTPPTPGAQPQHVGGYSITAPNQSRRDKLQATANKELEDLEKWKEEHRYGPINLTPIELGGSISQTEARQQQQRKQQLSKYQQRAKKEEYDRKKREQEEAELQKMKAIQREKANKLEETRRQQQEQRKAQLQTNHYHTNQQFFQRMDPNRYSANSYPTYSSPQPSASWAKKEEYDRKRREQEEADLQKMKAIQREKANKLEETRRQQEEQRKAQLQTSHYHTNQQFFQRMDPNRYSANSYPTYSSPQPSASWAKKEEYDRKRREQEEADLQKMKAIQREKANKLEETRRQQEEQRKAQLQTSHYHTNQQFFQRMDPNRYSANSYPTYSSPQPSASWNDLLEGKESEMEEERQKQLKEDHRRKNNTFLDKLEMRSQMGENSPSSSLGLPANNDLSEHDTTLRPEVAHNLYSDWEDQTYCVNSTEDEDYQWSLMKLQASFPHYEKDVLETLLKECNGDLENVTQLLL
ncbi:epithelial-stromal interaction protein 1 isoform X1 [Callorhinchus milii]|uniref:epithelial-stromal interaction protein 1 isoform X1 n=1 Tax=Callorhinchus milii TaxID=7868 RepID=UPI001C3FE2BA|nr:epithelial-stromal interaction protein 1 isoform X1 [Callorhinchus milii]